MKSGQPPSFYRGRPTDRWLDNAIEYDEDDQGPGNNHWDDGQGSHFRAVMSMLAISATSSLARIAAALEKRSGGDRPLGN